MNFKILIIGILLLLLVINNVKTASSVRKMERKKNDLDSETIFVCVAHNDTQQCIDTIDINQLIRVYKGFWTPFD